MLNGLHRTSGPRSRGLQRLGLGLISDKISDVSVSSRSRLAHIPATKCTFYTCVSALVWLASLAYKSYTRTFVCVRGNQAWQLQLQRQSNVMQFTHGAIVASTVTATIGFIGCGDDRPVYTLYKNAITISTMYLLTRIVDVPTINDSYSVTCGVIQYCKKLESSTSLSVSTAAVLQQYKYYSFNSDLIWSLSQTRDPICNWPTRRCHQSALALAA